MFKELKRAPKPRMKMHCFSMSQVTDGGLVCFCLGNSSLTVFTLIVQGLRKCCNKWVINKYESKNICYSAIITIVTLANVILLPRLLIDRQTDRYARQLFMSSKHIICPAVIAVSLVSGTFKVSAVQKPWSSHFSWIDYRVCRFECNTWSEPSYETPIFFLDRSPGTKLKLYTPTFISGCPQHKRKKGKTASLYLFSQGPNSPSFLPLHWRARPLTHRMCAA